MPRIADIKQDPDGGSPIAPANPGDYWKLIKNDGSIEWYAMVPTGWVGNLSAHDVTEHEDGTITVSPSILVHKGAAERRQWHGYLEHGEWRSV